MDLPRELLPWASLLDLLPRDLALATGGLVRRFSQAVGPLADAAQPGRAEPDGYSGIHMRGSHELLLPSELLLAGELPDEFIRRAAMHEQLFFQRQLKERRGGALSVVLFDCGPAQLGEPRVAHLALLVLFVRRAEAGGADFAWGVLQKPGEGLRRGASRESLLYLIEARTLADPEPSDLETWGELLAKERLLNDLWVVSDGPHEIPGRAADQVAVIDEYIPDERALSIAVRRRGQTREIRLDMPEEDACARLLRRQWKRPPTQVESPKESVVAEAGLLFLSKGNKLAIKLDNGAVAIYSIPQATGMKTRRPMIHKPKPNHELIAIACEKRKVMTITVSAGRLFVRSYPPRMEVSVELTNWIVLGKNRLRPCLIQKNPPLGRKREEFEKVYFIDDEGCLATIRWRPQNRHSGGIEGDFTAGPKGFVAMGNERGDPAGAMKIEQQISTARLDDRQPNLKQIAVVPWKAIDPIEFGCAFSNVNSRRIFLAAYYRIDDWTWVLASSEKEIRIRTPKGSAAIGAFQMRAEYSSLFEIKAPGSANFSIPTAPLLATINPCGKRVRISTVDQSGWTCYHELPSESSPIACASANSDEGRIAWLLESGELAVYSLLRREFLLRVQSGE